MAMLTDSPSSADFDPNIYARLLDQYRALSPTDKLQQWLLLEAAHVVGQARFLPHLETHALMLGLAWRNHDWAEAAGQVLRLLLVPLGHALGRLPVGNPGRSNISAFQPMPVRPDIAHAIKQAKREATGTV